MLPRPRRAQLDQFIVQALPAALDPATHDIQIPMPRSGEFVVLQNLLDNRGAATRRHAVLSTDNVAQMSKDGGIALGARPAQDEMQRADTLAVQTKVLGKGLRDEHVHVWLFGEKVADRPRVLGDAAGGEALVRHVEEGEDAFALADVGDALPLLVGGVEAGGVVCAGLEEDGVAFLGVALEGRLHALKVQAAGLRVVVWIEALLDVWAGEVPDCVVVAPCRVRDPNVLWLEILC